VQRSDAVERTRRCCHQLGADTIPGQARNGLGHSSSFTHFVGASNCAHYSCASVDVCGVRGRVSEISP